MNEKWDNRFLDLARHISDWSKDPSTKIGAVITRGKEVVSLGYNGFPSGVDDTQERLENRDLKYKFTIHAERNAILFARGSLQGTTIYTIPFMPCSTCAGLIIQAGIIRVVAPHSDYFRWKEEFELASIMFEEAGVELVLTDKEKDVI